MEKVVGAGDSRRIKKHVSHKSSASSFELVNNAIDDKGCPIPNLFFDSFGGSEEDEEETACCSIPDWHASDEDVCSEEWCGFQPKDPKDPILEEEWTEVMHKKVT